MALESSAWGELLWPALRNERAEPRQEAAEQPVLQAVPMVAQTTFSLWQDIVNMIPAAIIGIDSEELVVLANTRVRPILGLDQWSLLGVPVSDALPSELATIVRPVIAGLVPGRTRKTSINGKEVQIECVALNGSLEAKPRGALLLAFVLL